LKDQPLTSNKTPARPRQGRKTTPLDKWTTKEWKRAWRG